MNKFNKASSRGLSAPWTSSLCSRMGGMERTLAFGCCPKRHSHGRFLIFWGLVGGARAMHPPIDSFARGGNSITPSLGFSKGVLRRADLFVEIEIGCNGPTPPQVRARTACSLRSFRRPRTHGLPAAGDHSCNFFGCPAARSNSERGRHSAWVDVLFLPCLVEN